MRELYVGGPSRNCSRLWDRRRFHLFWDWEYRFEAYLPAHERGTGHYAMPMLWGEPVLGWANV